ncbi:MAG: hypothetical protein HRT89_19755 [Lentisphaeria bacterium]|nr:hypothetical protein [Lentisphaeria bacterium]NQZ70293.1 hypothetical protein [Lentisphaeria bacterium]
MKYVAIAFVLYLSGCALIYSEKRVVRDVVHRFQVSAGNEDAEVMATYFTSDAEFYGFQKAPLSNPPIHIQTLVNNISAVINLYIHVDQMEKLDANSYKLFTEFVISAGTAVASYTYKFHATISLVKTAAGWKISVFKMTSRIKMRKS